MLRYNDLKGCLPASTIREFFEAWGEVVGLVDRLKAASLGGKLLQYPKIPSPVSESLAARMLILAGIFPSATSIARGGGSDVSVHADGRRYGVEVKGSGEAEFQTLGAKDYACDLLMWLRFGKATEMSLRGSVRATLFDDPKEALGNLGTRVNHANAETAARQRGCTPRYIERSLADLLSDSEAA